MRSLFLAESTRSMQNNTCASGISTGISHKSASEIFVLFTEVVGGIKEYREAQLKGQYTTEAAVGAEPVKVCANSHRAFGEGAIMRKVFQALWVTLLFSVALLLNITWRKCVLITYKAMDLMLLRHGIETYFLLPLTYFNSYDPHRIHQV